MQRPQILFAAVETAMRMVVWEERYNLGIATIDGHHRHLVDLLNRSYAAIIIEHNLNEVRNVFHELLDYAGYHFRAEEEIMRRCNYGRTAAHIAEHVGFVNRMNELLDRLLSAEVQFDVEVIIFLEEWLLNHISVVDKDFAAFVKISGYTDAA
jgi:hemerythrin-like metal-binding protein